jgi:hypothetical protein
MKTILALKTPVSARPFPIKMTLYEKEEAPTGCPTRQHRPLSSAPLNFLQAMRHVPRSNNSKVSIKVFLEGELSNCIADGMHLAYHLPMCQILSVAFRTSCDPTPRQKTPWSTLVCTILSADRQSCGPSWRLSNNQEPACPSSSWSTRSMGPVQASL